MKKTFLLLINVIILLAVIGFIAIAEFQLGQWFNWPDWAYLIISTIAIVLLFEVPARFGLQKFETPISLFQKQSTRNQVVIAITAFVFFVMISWLPLAFFLLIFFMCWLILFLFGNEETKNAIITEHFRNSNTRDKMVILIAFLTRLIIIFPIGMSLAIRLGLPVFFGIFLIGTFVHIPIFFVFGSQNLRATVIPKWIKNTANKS